MKKNILRLIENPFILYAFYCVLIFAVFTICNSFDFLGFQYGRHFGSFQNFDNANNKMNSEDLIKISIQSALEHPDGYFRFRGLLSGLDGLNPYGSQAGLQGLVLQLFAPGDPTQLDKFFSASRTVLGLFFSIVLSSFLLKARYEFGFISALVGLVITCVSPWLIAFSQNLYWVIFIQFIPFVFTWVAYKWFLKKNLFWLYLVSILIFIAIKSLCGYEYLSNIVLSPLVAIVYYEIKEKSNLKTILLRSISVIIAGGLGFLIALLVHLGELWLYQGSLVEAIQIVLSRANARTVGAAAIDQIPEITLVINKLRDKGIDLGDGPLTKAFFTFLAAHYGNLVYSHWSLYINNIIVIIFATITGFIYLKSGSLKIKSVAISLLVAVVVSLSWGILAFSHHLHIQLNSITYHLPLYLYGYVAIPFLLWRR